MSFVGGMSLGLLLLSTGGEIDTGKRTSAELRADRVGEDRCGRQEGRVLNVGECASILTGARKSRLPCGAYLPFSDLHNCLFSRLWREGLLSRRAYRSCGMSLSDRGISPIGAWSLKCPVSSQCVCLSVCGLHVQPDAHSAALSAAYHTEISTEELCNQRHTISFRIQVSSCAVDWWCMLGKAPVPRGFKQPENAIHWFSFKLKDTLLNLLLMLYSSSDTMHVNLLQSILMPDNYSMFVKYK